MRALASTHAPTGASQAGGEVSRACAALCGRVWTHGPTLPTHSGPTTICAFLPQQCRGLADCVKFAGFGKAGLTSRLLIYGIFLMSTSRLSLSSLLPVQTLASHACLPLISPLSLPPWRLSTALAGVRAIDATPRLIRSAHSCSPPPRPCDSTRDARATPVSTGCDHLFSASPSKRSPPQAAGLLGTKTYANKDNGASPAFSRRWC